MIMSNQTPSTIEIKLHELANVSKRYIDGKVASEKVYLFDKATATQGYFKTYILAAGVDQESEIIPSGASKNLIGYIDIPKSYLGIKSCNVLEVRSATDVYSDVNIIGNVDIVYEANTVMTESYQLDDTYTWYAIRQYDRQIYISQGVADGWITWISAVNPEGTAPWTANDNDGLVVLQTNDSYPPIEEYADLDDGNGTVDLKNHLLQWKYDDPQTGWDGRWNNLGEVGQWMVVAVDNVPVTPYIAPPTINAEGIWLDFVVETGEEEESHLSVNMSTMVETYVNGSGIDITNHVIAIDLAEASGLGFDANGRLKINVSPNNANGLTITTSGLSIETATPSVNGVGGRNGALSAQDKEQIDDSSIEHLTDAEIASWFGYAADSEMVLQTLTSVSDEPVTEV